MLPDWLNYELQIHQLLSYEYPTAIVIHNARMKGKMSLRHRQLDVILLKGRSNKNFGFAECKYLKNRNIDVTKVDAMIGKMKDVGAKFGILVTTGNFSKPAKRMADCNGITIKSIPYEFLKDYGFQSANNIGTISEYIHQEVEYPSGYCKKCKKTNLYEVKIIRGFAGFGNIECPECSTALFETRLDGNYRVIKRFPSDNISEYEISEVIVSHLIWTRLSWDRMFSIESILSDGMKVKPGSNCYICRKYFDEGLLGSMKHRYKGRNICIECFMSSRTLLIDCAIESPTFEDFFSPYMQNEKNWASFKTQLMTAYHTQFPE
ncbi:MAG: restriction endonuclease [Chitinophagaceae bacterium]|nr:restriction endonuclease [Chitinophagaceae bacterium]